MGVDVRAAVAATLLAVCLSGCTPEPVVTPTPTSASQSPTETEQEREQRVAYEAAEKSYREFRAELYRVLGDGGASRATTKMTETSAGPYLAEFDRLIAAYKMNGSRTQGTQRTGYVRPSGYSPTSLILDVCEDSTGVKEFDSSDKQTGAGEIRLARIDVRRVSGSWRLWDGQGKKVSSCDE